MAGMFKKKKLTASQKPMRIRTGDDVIIISGAGRSNTPRKVLSTLPREGKVIVEGVNVMKDRQKNASASGRSSGITEQDVIEKPFPIDASNVMLVDPTTKKRTRVAIKKQADGKRARVAVKSGEAV